MKALIVCPVRGNTELKRYFPGYPVYMLPFANKPAIEFLLDYCFLLLRLLYHLWSGLSSDHHRLSVC